MTTLTLARQPERGALVRAVCVREWREALSNKLLVGMTLLPPLVILAAGIGAVAAAAANPPSDRDVQALYAAAPAVAGLDPKEAVQGFIATYFLILFMLIPTVVPLTMAIYSVIGEKAARTLEPLLATPVTAGQLLLGKSLAAVAPAVGITWAAFACFAVGADLLTFPLLRRLLLPDATFLFAVLVLSPLLSFLGNLISVLISSQVNDPRLAQSLSGLVVMPLFALVALQFAGLLTLGPVAYAALALGALAADLVMLRLAIALFDRDRLLTRWG